MGLTDCGRLRERNEDDLAVDPALGLAVVADGMGGLQDGHVASREAVTAVMDHLRSARRPVDDTTLEAALEAADERVRRRARSTDKVMGTTAVVLALHDGVGRLAYVGDSRGYRFRDGEIELLTRDHSMVQEMLERGLITPDAARRSPSRNVITRAIGLEAAFEPESCRVPTRSGDLLLLCSDGLWDMLEDDRIAALLSRCGPGPEGLEECAGTLVEAANEAGGLDNITVVLARG